MLQFSNQPKNYIAQKAIVCALSASMMLSPLTAIAAESDTSTNIDVAPVEDQSPAAKLIKQAVDTGHLPTQADKDTALAEAQRIVDLNQKNATEKINAVTADAQEMKKQEQEQVKQTKAMETAKTQAYEIMAEYLNNLEEAKATVQGEIDKLTAKKTALETETGKLTTDIDAKKAKVQALEETLNGLTTEEATTAKTEADANLEAAKTAKTNAENELTTTKAKLQTAKDKVAELEGLLAAKKAELEPAKTAAAEAEAELAAANERLVQAKEAEKTAKDNGEAKVNQPEVDRLTAEVGAAESKLQNLNSDKSAKEQKVTRLEAEVQQARDAISAIDAEVVEKQAAIITAEQKIAEIEAENKTNQTEIDAKQAEKDKILAERSKAQDEQAKVEKEIKDLEVKKKTNTDKIAELDNKIAELKASSEDAKEEAEKIARWKTEGIAGFYEYVGATEALQILKGEGRYNQKVQGTDNTFASYTHLGEEGDATSLDNVEFAVNLIKLGNDLRMNAPDRVEGSNAKLKISLNLMALAEVNANWSARTNTIEHADKYGQANSWAENAAWGSLSDTELASSSYNGWYTYEKKVYDYLQQKGISYNSIRNDDAKKIEIAEELGLPSAGFVQIGHYTSLMEKPSDTNPTPYKYYYTGMGHSTLMPVYGTSDVQGFHRDFDVENFSDGSVAVPKGMIYTVEEFEAKLNEYKAVLANAPKDPADAIQKLEEQKAALVAENGTLDTSIAEKKTTEKNATDKLAELAKQDTDLGDAINALQNEVNVNKSKLNDLNTQKSADAAAIATADTMKEEQNNKIVDLNKQIDSIRAELIQLESEIATANKDLATLKADLEEAKKGSFESYEKATKEAEKAVKAAEDKFAAATKTKTDLEKAISDLSTEAAAETAKADELEPKVPELETKLEEAKSALADAETAVETAKTNLDNAQKRDSAKAELDTLTANKQAKDEELQATTDTLAKKTAELAKLNDTVLDKDLAWENGFAAAARRLRRAAVTADADGKHPRTNLDSKMMDKVEELRKQYADAKTALESAKAAYAEAEKLYSKDSAELKQAEAELKAAQDTYDKVVAAIVDKKDTATQTEDDKKDAATQTEDTKQAEQKNDKKKYEKAKHAAKKTDKKKSNLPKTGDAAAAYSLVAAGGLSMVGVAEMLRRRREQNK